MHNLRAFSFATKSKLGEMIEFHQSDIFIPSEKDSQIVITNIIGTCWSNDKDYPNRGYAELFTGYFPNEKFYSQYIRRITANVAPASGVLPVDNIINISPGTWLATRSEIDWTRQECFECAGVVGLNVFITPTTAYPYRPGDKVIVLSDNDNMPANLFDPSVSIMFSGNPKYVPMVSYQGENIYTAHINMPLKVRMYGNDSRIVVSGYWKDAV